ncbi:MAG: hypothetical protein ABIA93_01485 [Candidatus Woesearchaeota archaeon]
MGKKTDSGEISDVTAREQIIAKLANRPCILVVADAGLDITIVEAIMGPDPFRYDIRTLQAEYARTEDKQPAGLAEGELIQRLLENDPRAYDVILVDLLCSDLIPEIRRAGFKRPIIGINSFNDNLPHKMTSSEGLPTYFKDKRSETWWMGTPIEGADTTIAYSGGLRTNLHEALDTVLDIRRP